jgi:hypothetical protein
MHDATRLGMSRLGHELEGERLLRLKIETAKWGPIGQMTREVEMKRKVKRKR